MIKQKFSRRELLSASLSLPLIAQLGCQSSGGGGEQSQDVVSSQELAANTNLTVGAHYYHWFPDNFRQGYLRSKLIPQQELLLGEYSSLNPSVSEQHINWASEHKIDFFTLDYWPGRELQNRAIERGFLRAVNLNKIKFAIFFETWDLAWNSELGTTALTEAAISNCISHIEYISKTFFGHPSYLTVNNQPVLFLYLTRTLTGLVEKTIETIRITARRFGFELFLIADEVYWEVVPFGLSELEGGGTPEPQLQRIALFDALFCYNPYATNRADHGGYPSQSNFFSDVNQLFKRYRSVADIPVIPCVIPGYNDRGVRPKEDHYVISRQYSESADHSSTLREMFHQVAIPNLAKELPIITVTSWNEWNEDTGIEPLTLGTETNQPLELTQGYKFLPHEFSYLEVIREIKLG